MYYCNRTISEESNKIHSLSYGERLKILNMITLEQRRYLLDVTFLYKAVNGHIDMDITSHIQFCSANDRYSLRNKDSLTIKKGYCGTNVFKYSFFNRIVDSWNSLPKHIRCATNVSYFNSMVYLLSPNFIVSIYFSFIL